MTAHVDLSDEDQALEASVASRQLLLADDLLGSTTAQWRGRTQDYLRVSVGRLAHRLVTGRLTHVVPVA